MIKGFFKIGDYIIKRDYIAYISIDTHGVSGTELETKITFFMVNGDRIFSNVFVSQKEANEFIDRNVLCN